MWLYPALAIETVIRNLNLGVMSVAWIDGTGAAIFVMALLLPIRKFFPKS
jgi:hypothetical protein